MKILGATLILVLFCAGCETIDSAPIVQRIEFGGGGGFLPSYVSYSLDASGQLTGLQHNWPRLDSGILFIRKTIDPSIAKRYLGRASKLLTYNYNKPASWSSFLSMHGSLGDHSIVWGYNPGEVDPRVLKLYDDLDALLK